MPRTRTEFGFPRTSCDCRLCRVFCRHYPGFLIPADLRRLVPPDQDPFEWAREHLRVRVRPAGRTARNPKGVPLVTEALLPATTAAGACHWYREGRCAIHAVAPFGCAFFDQHQSERQAENRANRAQAVIELALADPDSLYRRLCDDLLSRGLVVLRADLKRAARAARRELDRMNDRSGNS